MIVHRLGADTRLAYEWLDDDELPIEAEAAEFIVDGELLWDLTTVGTGLATSVLGGVTLHLPDDIDLTPGNHTYTLLAQDSGGDWTILSGGLLRVRS